MPIVETASLFFAAVSAVSNMTQAYSSYRANHPRSRRTGRIDNYTATHQGYNMMLQNSSSQQVPYYTQYIYMLPQQPVQVLYNAPARTQSYNYGQPGQGGRYTPQHSGQTSYYAQSRAPSQSFNYARAPSRAPVQTVERAYRLGGQLKVVREQKADDTYEDDGVGMSTGRRPGYNKSNACSHWSTFQVRPVQTVETIAVVDWTLSMITMYVKNDDHEMYFRNYHVVNGNVEAFARENRSNQVFSGILKSSKLVGCNQELVVVEDDGFLEVESNNCWSLLGISGKVRGDLVFVEMPRAAVFGLIQCRYADPTLLNVDMIEGDGMVFVHVDAHGKNLEFKGDCMFSVFSFGDRAWATERVYVG